jgi:hypothetical protein
MLGLSALGALTLLAACEDKRVKAMDTGISRDSALSILTHESKTSGPDSLPNVYTREKFLVGGKNMEVMYFTPNNEKVGGKDTIPMGKLTPLVFVEGKLIGKGWTKWDSIATANGIPVKKR